MKLRIIRLLSLLLAMAASFYACRKTGVEKINTAAADTNVFDVTEARNYFNVKFQKTISSSINLRHLAPDIYPMYPHWRKATAFKKGNYSYVEVPTAFTIKNSFIVKPKTSGLQAGSWTQKYPAQGLQRLLIFRDEKGKTGELNINYIPDEEYLASKGNDISENRLHQVDPGYNGFIIYSRTNNTPLFMARVEKGKFVRTMVFKAPGSATARKAPSTSRDLASYECWEYCVEHWEKSCWAIPDPLPGGPIEECSEPAMVGETCTYECFPVEEELPDPENPGEYPGEDDGGIAIPFLYSAQYIVNAPTAPVNISDFLKCFNRLKGATFTIYADQPVAGARNSIDLGAGGTDVGHAFVTIEQTSLGVTYSRTFGFYPRGDAGLLSPQDNAAFSNDGNQGYDVKITKTITPSQLSAIIHKAVSASSVPYNLYQYNCANFAIDLANLAGMNVPYSKGTFFPACNPGELGQDLRSIPGAISTPGTSPAKAGNCN
ncbi:hypothetical protein [Chitinophaga sp. 22620]|uniref:hypothetical protein n=1 Tax=Chitinophaga sp. 22620 TaxID=3453952 RepID=UPI003F86D4ED